MPLLRPSIVVELPRGRPFGPYGLKKRLWRAFRGVHDAYCQIVWASKMHLVGSVGAPGH